MNQTPKIGDLIETPSGKLGIVVGFGKCEEPSCRGDLRVRLLGQTRGAQPLCYPRLQVAVIARADELAVEDAEPESRPAAPSLADYDDGMSDFGTSK